MLLLLCISLSAPFLIICFSCLLVRATSAISSVWQAFFARVWWWIEKHSQTYCYQCCHCTTEMHAVVIYWEAGHNFQWQTVLDHLYLITLVSCTSSAPLALVHRLVQLEKSEGKIQRRQKLSILSFCPDE